jgi:hypothetical protein
MVSRDVFLKEFGRIEDNEFIKRLLSTTTHKSGGNLKRKKKDKSYKSVGDYIKAVKEFSTSELIIDFETRLAKYKLKSKLEDKETYTRKNINAEIDKYEIELVNKLIKRYNELLKSSLLDTDRELFKKSEFKELLFKLRTLYRKKLKDDKSKIEFLKFVDNHLKYSFDLKNFKFLFNLFIEFLNSFKS